MTTTAAASPGDADRRATLVRWLRPDGARVAVDDPICELETDKAAVEVPAWAAGILRHRARAGDAVTADDEIARIDPAP